MSAGCPNLPQVCPYLGTSPRYLLPAACCYNTPMRILAVDPGDKRIGLALSDPTQTLARPLQILQHTARDQNAAAIIALAQQHGAETIIVGQATDEDGTPNLSGRKAARLAGAIRTQSDHQVILWDESYSTQDAKQLAIQLGIPKQKRSSHLDDLSAALILQSYLDSLQTT